MCVPNTHEQDSIKSPVVCSAYRSEATYRDGHRQWAHAGPGEVSTAVQLDDSAKAKLRPMAPPRASGRRQTGSSTRCKAHIHPALPECDPESYAARMP
jgi:hypothetical protein